MKDYKKFLKAFMDSWKKLEGEKICDMFSSKIKYYENPIDPPTEDFEEVKKLWVVVPNNQKDITYTGKILFEDDKSCIYHFQMQRTMVATNKVQEIDGVFEIKLDKNNKLTYFKQWRFTREI